MIDGKSTPTIHPLIFKANEKFIPEKELFVGIEALEKALRNDNRENVLDILFKIIK